MTTELNSEFHLIVREQSILLQLGSGTTEFSIFLIALAFWCSSSALDKTQFNGTGEWLYPLSFNQATMLSYIQLFTVNVSSCNVAFNGFDFSLSEVIPASI